MELYTLYLENGTDLYLNGYNIEDMNRTVDEETGVITLENKSLKIEYHPNTGNLYYYD
jgi:hypothetical protein